MSSTYSHGYCQGQFPKTNMLTDELKVDEKKMMKQVSF